MARPAVTVRRFVEEDVPGLLRLWAENTSWGALAQAQWDQWYLRGPLGPSLTMVGEDDAGEVAAQMVFIPARVSVAGREVKALRISVPILRRDLREADSRIQEHRVTGDIESILAHPMTQLYLRGIEAAVAEGYGLIYAHPHTAWLPLMAGLGGVAEYQCVAAEFGPDAPDALGMPAGLAARTIGTFSSDFDGLWQSARRSLTSPCAVVRDATWLRWRDAGNQVVEVRRVADESLLGFVAVSRPSGGTSLVEDMLAQHPDEIESVLAAAMAHLATAPAKDEWPEIKGLKLMLTPTLAPAAEALGYTPIDYTFGFACGALDPGLPAEVQDPQSWYTMPGD